MSFPSMPNIPNPTSLFSSGDAPQKCTQCQAEFGMQTFRYQCRKCQLSFCNECTQNRCIIPQSQAQNDRESSQNSWFPTDLMSSSGAENDFRKPQRVCYTCYYSLRDQQEELRQAVSKYVFILSLYSHSSRRFFNLNTLNRLHSGPTNQPQPPTQPCRICPVPLTSTSRRRSRRPPLS